jgi:putative transcriptional regulator
MSMPIIVNLDVVLAQRKMRLNDLAAAVDITPQNLSILKTGKARAIRFSTLEAICRTLGCQPGDILEFRPEAGVSDAAPLSQPSSQASPSLLQ